MDAATYQALLAQARASGLLSGNDGLREQFAGDPSREQWLNDREARVLGLDSYPGVEQPMQPAAQQDAPPIITATAPMPAPAPPPMLPPQMPATAPPLQSLPPQMAPQQPPMLPQAPVALPEPPLPPMAPPQAAPAPIPAPPQSAPMMPQQAQITPLPQQAPVMSQVSPAPAVAAHANIDNSVTPSHPTFTQAYQPPPLPTFMGANLVPDLGGYKPAPQVPGYAQPRQGNPFMARHPAAQAPQLPSFDNPFASPGGPMAGGGLGGGGISAPTFAQTPYDENFYARLMMPGGVSQF